MGFKLGGNYRRGGRRVWYTFYVSDNVMTRVHLANNILVHIIMLLFKSHPVYRQFKKLVKNIRAN